MKRTVCILLVIAIVFSLTSCSKIKEIFSGQQEQSFSYPIEKMPESLDPQIASAPAELIVIENCMEGLVRLNEKGDVVPAVADSWDISADGLKYTFHLNANALWNVDTSDEDFELKNFDTHITAQDFVFAISRAVKQETQAPDFQSVSLIKNAGKINASGKNNTSSLGVKAADAHTLVITLESANSDFLKSLTAAVFMPCDEQFFEYCSGRYGRQADYFLSNGGFELGAWTDTNLVLKKSESYALPNGAKADSVTLYRDENAFESFKNNNYDALAVEDDNIDEALADKSLHVQTYDDTVWAFAVNCGRKIGSYKQLRQALMCGFDRSEFTAPEWASAPAGIVPNICTAGGEGYRKAAGAAALRAFSAAKAGEYYRSFSDKYMRDTDSDEIPVFRFLCTAAFEQIAKQMVQSWQMEFGTGFEVKIAVLSLDEMTEHLSAGSFDGVIMPVSADTTDALVFLKKFSAENDFAYSSNTYNHLLASDKSEVKKCMQAEQLLLSDAVIYPLYAANSYYVQRAGISGIYFYAFGGKVNFLNAERVEG